MPSPRPCWMKKELEQIKSAEEKSEKISKKKKNVQEEKKKTAEGNEEKTAENDAEQTKEDGTTGNSGSIVECRAESTEGPTEENSEKTNEKTGEKPGEGYNERDNDASANDANRPDGVEAQGITESEEPLPIDDDEKDSPESEEEIVTREVESSGVVRRFAHFRALQVLSLPIRACLCKASTVSGALYPVPDGANDIISCPLAAKSLAVLTSIWSTVGSAIGCLAGSLLLRFQCFSCFLFP